jgi:hypothetical protein
MQTGPNPGSWLFVCVCVCVCVCFSHNPLYSHTTRHSALPCTAEDLDDEGLDMVKQVVADVFDDPPVQATYANLAKRIRLEINKRMQERGWCVVVGRSYGAYITQKIKAYAYISVFPGAFFCWGWVCCSSLCPPRFLTHCIPPCPRACPTPLRRQCFNVEGLMGKTLAGLEPFHPPGIARPLLCTLPRVLLWPALLRNTLFGATLPW